MTNNTLDVRVYPINEPKGSTLAFASIAIGDMAAIRGVRVVNSAKGVFVSMPQSKNDIGEYRDIAFPLSGDLRNDISSAVLGEYEKQAGLEPEQRGYGKPEIAAGGRNAEDIKLGVMVFPIAEPKGATLAFASVAFDETVAIRGIRVISSEKGNFVSMPQTKDKNDEYHDVAFPLSGDLRRAVSKAVLDKYNEKPAEKKQSIADRIADGKEAAAQHTTNAPEKPAAKRSPGLGD